MADLERKVAAGEATQADLDAARQRATEAAAEATQAKERAQRARVWTDEFSQRVTAASEKLAKAEQAWRDAASQGASIEGPKDTTPWGLVSWVLSTGLLLILNEKRKRDATAALEAAKADAREVVATQDAGPFVGTGGTHRVRGASRRRSRAPRRAGGGPQGRRRAQGGMSHDAGPPFVLADSEDPAPRVRRLEDWAGRHEQWATQTAGDLHERAEGLEVRVCALEGRVVRLFAAVGEHRLKWGIVAWVVGTAAAAAIAMLAR